MIVYCLGMQSSGSTWLYNVVRELLAASGTPHVALRAELYEHFLDDRCIESPNALLRGHIVDSALLRMLALAGVRTVLSFREPRDAVASFVQRFGDYGATFISSCNDIARNLASLLTASQTMAHLSFFYEDRFTENPDSVRRLAAFFGLPVAENTQRAIFDKYRAATVKTFLRNIDALPEDRLYVDGARNAMDRETSFHRTHISDMRIGKWRDVLTGEQQAAVEELFADYAALLEERAVGTGPKAGPANRVERLRPFGIVFASALFAPVNDIHAFTHFLRGRDLRVPFGVQALREIYLPQGNWHIEVRAPEIGPFGAQICQNGAVVCVAWSEGDAVRFDYHNKLHDHPLDVAVQYHAMDDDVEADAPPPRATLTARFSPD